MTPESGLAQYKVREDFHTVVPQAYGEFSPFHATPEFLANLPQLVVLVAIQPEGGEYNSTFSPQEWYSIPGSVFLELIRSPNILQSHANGRTTQFFYLKNGEEFVTGGKEVRQNQSRLVMEVPMAGKQLSLYWDAFYTEYVMYCPQIQFTSMEEIESGILSPDSAPDQLVRISKDEAIARTVFLAVCEEVRKCPQMTLRELYEVMREKSLVMSSDINF